MQSARSDVPALTGEDLVRLLAPIIPESQPQGVRGRARHRLRLRGRQTSRGSAPTCSPIARAPAPCSASSRQRSSRPKSSGLSPHILNLCQLNKGLVLVTGPTGSGKSTTLCALIDYINRNAPRPHHHDRGPDRVRPREPEVPHQPARGAHAHRLVQGRAARRAARRSRTSSSSASCAISRPSRSRSRPRKPGTSSSARCTRRPPPPPSIASSISSRPIGRRRSASCCRNR